MKRTRCPKCGRYILFDETRYRAGQSLVFECEDCRTRFSVRMGVTALDSTRKEADNSNHIPDLGFGAVTVIENVFGFRQSFALHEGDNVIGRQNRGDKVDIAIESTDRSMDRRHCIINVKKEQDGSLSYSLRDFPSLTGTFLFNRILDDRERALIEDGAIITLGATTMVFHSHSGLKDQQ